MKAFLIDPWDHEITEIEYSGDFHDIYKLIGAETFAVARLSRNGDGIYVDDEGLIHDNEKAMFEFAGYPQPLAGCGLLLGTDMNTGDEKDPVITLEEVRSRVRFLGIYTGNLDTPFQRIRFKGKEPT